MGSRGSDYNQNSISGAKDFDELQGTLTKAMGSVWIDPSLKKNADFEAVKEAMKAVDKMTELFPVLKKNGLSLRYNSGGKKDGFINGMTAYGELYFGNKYYQKNNPGINDVGDQGNFHPKGFDSKQCIAHELGHYLESIYLNKYNKELANANGGAVKAFNKGLGARKIFNDVFKDMKKEGYKGTLRQLREQISGYADTNWAEAGAEAIADYFSNGKNASRVSQLYVEKLLAEMQ